MRKLILLASSASVPSSSTAAWAWPTASRRPRCCSPIGTNPAAASATVHLAEIGTTLASGVSHWRFGNVDWKVVAKIGVPGAVGAFAGATFLSSLSTEVAAPVMSLILLALGRLHPGPLHRSRPAPRPARQAAAQALPRPRSGLVAGFVDATGGGGWGPVGTPAILASGRLEPRKVIGSIDASEFLVAIAASVGFFVGLGSEGINFAWVAVLLIGGVIAAPIAAWLVRHIPPRVLGSAVGGIIILTNIRTLLRSDWIDAPGGVAVRRLRLHPRPVGRRRGLLGARLPRRAALDQPQAAPAHAEPAHAERAAVADPA